MKLIHFGIGNVQIIPMFLVVQRKLALKWLASKFTTQVILILVCYWMWGWKCFHDEEIVNVVEFARKYSADVCMCRCTNVKWHNSNSWKCEIKFLYEICMSIWSTLAVIVPVQNKCVVSDGVLFYCAKKSMCNKCGEKCAHMNIQALIFVCACVCYSMTKMNWLWMYIRKWMCAD